MDIFTVINEFHNKLFLMGIHLKGITFERGAFLKFKEDCLSRSCVSSKQEYMLADSDFVFDGIKFSSVKQESCQHKNWSVQDSCMIGCVKCLDCGQEISIVTAFNNLKNDMEKVISLITNK